MQLKRSLIFLCVTFLTAYLISARITREMYFERTELIEVDHDFAEVATWLAKYNRTAWGYNLNLTIFTIPPNDIIMIVNIYKLDNGVYKKTAIQLKKPVCRVLKEEFQLIYATMKEKYLQHFIQSCPIKKGFYYIRDGLIPQGTVLNPPWPFLFEIAVTQKSGKVLFKIQSAVGVRDIHI